MSETSKNKAKSKEDKHPFHYAQSIEITGTETVSKMVMSYTTYKIKSIVISPDAPNAADEENLPEFKEQVFEVARRYTQFLKMYSVLKTFPGVFVNEFPEKNAIDRYDNWTIQKRQECFTEFLKRSSAEIHPFVNQLLFLFLSLPNDELNYALERMPVGKMQLPSKPFIGSLFNVVPRVASAPLVQFAKKVREGIIYLNSCKVPTFLEGEAADFWRQLQSEHKALFQKLNMTELFKQATDEKDDEEVDKLKEIEERVFSLEKHCGEVENVRKSFTENFSKLLDALEGLLLTNEEILSEEDNPVLSAKKQFAVFAGLDQLRFTDAVSEQLEKLAEKQASTVLLYKNMDGSEGCRVSASVCGMLAKLAAFFEKQIFFITESAEQFELLEQSQEHFFSSIQEIKRLSKQINEFNIAINKLEVAQKEYYGETIKCKDIARKKRLQAMLTELADAKKAYKTLRAAFYFNFEKNANRFLKDVCHSFVNSNEEKPLKLKTSLMTWLETLKVILKSKYEAGTGSKDITIKLDKKDKKELKENVNFSVSN